MMALVSALSLSLLFMLMAAHSVKAEGWNDTQYIHNVITSFYSNGGTTLTNMIPSPDQTKPLSVLSMMFLYSVDGFDAVKGEVEIAGALYMEWTDYTRAVTIGNYDFLSFNEGFSILLSPDSIWTPPLVLLNAVDTIQKVGGNQFMVRYHPFDGRIKWHPRTLIKASCKPNIEYYPFDRQECEFAYTAWGYTADEIIMDPSQTDWYLCDYISNGIWRLVSSSASTYVKNNQSFVKFVFVIERAPKFFIINIICPIILLGVLNMFVFFLPAESGERVGFSITCFLTFVFMLQTVMNILPQTADPLSIFVLYCVVMMILSILLSISTVVTLRFYHKPKDAKVPQFVQKMARALTLKWLISYCKRNVVHHKGDNKEVDTKSNSNWSQHDGEGGNDVTREGSDVTRSISSESISSRVGSANPTPFDCRSDDASSVSTPATSRKSATAVSMRMRKLSRIRSVVSFDENTVVKQAAPSSDIYESVPKRDDVVTELSWPEVARIFDFSFFCFFMFVKFLCICIFIIPMSTKYTT